MSISNLTIDNNISIISGTSEIKTKASLPSFNAVKANESLISGITDVAVYDSVSGSLQDNFDLTTGEFIVPFDCGMLFTARYTHSSGAPSAADTILTIVNNNYNTGNNLQNIDANYTGGVVHPTVSGVMYVQAGDLIKFEVSQTVGSPLAVTLVNFTGLVVSF